LRLNFQTSEEKIALLENEKAFQNLSKPKKKGKAGLQQKEEGEKLQQKILSMLKSMYGSVIYKNREKFEKALKEHCKKYGLSLPTPIQKVILKALSEQDETADVCVDKKGNPEPDTALRDNENVPLKEGIGEYFKREVLPHVPDAWIDGSKTVKGYEINLTKYFYKYKPLRSLEEIRTDILEVELQTEGLISEIVEI
jgi:type I restriction enzyme M protein